MTLVSTRISLEDRGISTELPKGDQESSLGKTLHKVRGFLTSLPGRKSERETFQRKRNLQTHPESSQLVVYTRIKTGEQSLEKGRRDEGLERDLSERPHTLTLHMGHQMKGQ